MTAICKVIPIHGENLKPLLRYGKDKDKTLVSMLTDNKTSDSMQQVFDYAANPLKTICNIDETDQELLVSGIKCEAETAALEFALLREKYIANNGPEGFLPFDYKDKRTGKNHMVTKSPVTAIHLIQSFGETDIDPRVAHQIGIDLAEHLGVQAVVDTHMNRDHIHNHIIINAYLPDGNHKFCSDKDKILEIRQLSDDLQLAYGLELKMKDPTHQLHDSYGNHHNYREWSAKQAGLSWKDQMRQDMEAARNVSDNKEDFLNVMQEYGYHIARETNTSITWWNKDHTRKIRDKTLGDSFSIENLFLPNDSVSNEYEVNSHTDRDNKKHSPISVARYDWDGRRRSDLELIIRKAIAILQKVGGKYQYHHSTNLTPAYKLELMDQAISVIRDYGLQDMTSFQNYLNEIGAKLSHQKKIISQLESEKRYYDTISDLLSSISNYKGFQNVIPNLYLNQYDKKDIQRKKAEISPMCPAQRKELFLQLQKNPEYHLLCKYEEISVSDANIIFSYLNGKGTKMPPMLLDDENFATYQIKHLMNNIYVSKNEKLKERFGHQPLSEKQVSELHSLLLQSPSHKKQDRLLSETDFASLTQYDALNIKNCFGEPPFSDSFIDVESKQLLQCALSQRGFTLNRDIAYIQSAEYDTLMRFLEGHSRTVPPLLKECEPPCQMDLDKLQGFMDAVNLTCPIPLTKLSRYDYNKLYNYAISRNQIPDCLKNKISDKNQLFDNSISNLSYEKQLYFSQLRNLYNELLQFGIDPRNTTEIKKEIENFQAEYQKEIMLKDAYSKQYLSLLRLNQSLTYAENPNFLYGPLFEGNDMKPIVKEENRRDEVSPETKKDNKNKQDQKSQFSVSMLHEEHEL